MKFVKICLGIVGICWLVGVANSEDTEFSPEQLRQLNSVLYYVKRYYYKELDNRSIFKQMLEKLLLGLDPHSAYLDEEELKNLQAETTGKFGGVGVEIFPDAGAIRILALLDDTPASKAGIKSGDLIVQVDGKWVGDLSLKEVLNRLRGKPGSKVSLTILRRGKDRPLMFNLRREVISFITVKDRILERGYGYIRIALFQEPTELDVLKALKKMEKLSGSEGLKGLILDLRSNPGGLLESAVQVANSFLDGGKLAHDKVIVYTEGRIDEAKITAYANAGDIFHGRPIVLLIDEGTASAAEILAGALQDHRRATIVGSRSFGKGSVQTVIPIEDGKSAVKITTAVYYTPKGRSIQAKGIEPDIRVEEWQVVKDSLKENLPRFDEHALVDHIKNNQGGITDETKLREKNANKSNELAKTDYQLYEALQILKGQALLYHRK